MLEGIFAPTRRATHHEVILNVVVFIKPLLFSFLIPQGGISVLLGKRVTKVDPAAQTAFLSDGSEIKYDKCLIATG